MFWIIFFLFWLLWFLDYIEGINSGPYGKNDHGILKLVGGCVVLGVLFVVVKGHI